MASNQKRYYCGTEVMARWNGLYYPAKVIEVKEKSLFVRFDDGFEMDVDLKHVENKERFKQRKTRKSSRSRSPARRRIIVEPSKSTENEKVEPTSMRKSNKSDKTQHTVGILDNIITVFVYITLMSIPILLLACNGRDCQIETDPLHIFSLKSFDSYFNWLSLSVISAYVAFITVLYCMPVGRIVEGPILPWGNKLKYRINGPFTLFFVMMTFGFLVVSCEFPMKKTYDNLLQITVIYTLMAFLFHIAVYLVSFKSLSNQLFKDGNTGWPLIDCFVGRDIAPRFGKYFDVKMFTYYIGVTGVLVLNLVYVQTEMETTGTIRKELILVTGMHIAYTIVMFYFSEEKAFYSFDIKHEGCGFGFVYGATVFYPVVYTLQPRFIMDHADLPSISTLHACTAVVFFICGLGLTFYSDMEKFKFRKNPRSTQKFIAPSKKGGHPLLLSGPWGVLRHPNYLGEILTFIALSLPCGFNHFYIWLCPTFVLFFLSHRSTRDEKECLQKHGHAWQEYCNKVPYRVFPYIF